VAGAAASHAHRRDRRVVCIAALLGGAIIASCGARTGLHKPEPTPPGPPCVVDSDCAGFGDLCNPIICKLFESPADAGADAGAPAGGECVALEPVSCDDGDPCTLDTCEPTTGSCDYSLATLDLDGDGYRAPRPGTLPGAPDACGDDCDDSNAMAHPGGVEVCDGVDNDCNGVVDDNATYVPLSAEPVRISGDIAPAGPGGLAWSGSSYLAIYSSDSIYESLLSPTGDKLQPETPVTVVNADASGGPVLWVGDRYGLAWNDRRDGDYEIYFGVLNSSGGKVYPDTRITFATNFSLYPAIAWNGLHFVTVWQDQRDGIFNLYGQVLSVDAALEGSNVPLTTSLSYPSESPSVAAGVKTVGVAWVLGDSTTHYVQFQTFDAEAQLVPVSPLVTVTDGTTAPLYPAVVWNQDRYVIAWYDTVAFPAAIYAAALDENGNVLVPPTPITSPGSARSRYPYLRALGDRLLLIYSDDRDANDGYELYSRMISKDLSPLGPEQRLTFAPTESVSPVATFGPDGDVGILFRDDRLGQQHVFFFRLGCETGGP
jgi:hypothetical protein